MVIFHSYVKLPESTWNCTVVGGLVNDMYCTVGTIWLMICTVLTVLVTLSCIGNDME